MAIKAIKTGWIKKLWNIYFMEYHLATHKKQILLLIRKWLQLDTNMLSAISQLQKNKYHMFSFI